MIAGATRWCLDVKRLPSISNPSLNPAHAPCRPTTVFVASFLLMLAPHRLVKTSKSNGEVRLLINVTLETSSL